MVPPGADTAQVSCPPMIDWSVTHPASHTPIPASCHTLTPDASDAPILPPHRPYTFTPADQHLTSLSRGPGVSAIQNPVKTSTSVFPMAEGEGVRC
jgi:hypothetical protein